MKVAFVVKLTGTTVPPQIILYLFIAMSLKQNSDGSFTFTPDTKKIGVEDIPLGGCLPIDLTGDGTSIGMMGGLEYTTGGVLSLGLYAALHKFLTLEVARKAGLCDRAYQLRMTREAAWENCKDKAVYVIVLGLLAALFPGLGGILAVAGLVGGGFITYRLGSAVFACLDEQQIAELRDAANKAGMSVPGLNDAANERGSAAGYDETDPLPQGA